MSVKISADLSVFDEAIEAIRGLEDVDITPLLEGLGGKLESGARRRIEEDKEGPDGEAWPAWSAKYAAKRHGGNSLLSNEGALLDSQSYLVSGSTVEVGSNLVYAATHQFGDPRRNIPARPYLGVSSFDEEEMMDVINEFIAGLMTAH